MTASAPCVRARVRVHGTVQGVGFRPFVYRIAHEEELAGFVRNDEHGVVIEIEGDPTAVQRFLARLRADAPPLATVEAVSREPVSPRGERGFQILASAGAGPPDALIAPDTATCSDCLAELTDPSDRRYRYPFTNCTNCGPRFTIVRGVPYDRPLTTMAAFAMCQACRCEYEDPTDRRFHAQPNACPRCGPTLRATEPDGTPAPLQGAPDAIAWGARALAAGAVLAVKGLGGFHLVCDAADETAVTALRERKHREDKPFALMVATVAAAQELVALDLAAVTLLASAPRPIVLAPRRGEAPVAVAVAPDASELGVMLPYAPLHHLLLADFLAAGDSRTLVMTSGNLSDEPIAYRDQDALSRLALIADGFLIHDRPIQTRTDDSVMRTVRAGGRFRPLALRRSRGYVPAPLGLPIVATRPLLACGAEQKNTFTVAKGARAWVSHHIGDLEHAASLEAFSEGVAHFERLFAVEPALVVHDLHPGYLSTAYALTRAGVDILGVQHHHAHLAACLAEHGVTEPAVAAIYDGTGYGPDGTVWGGELLAGDLAGFTREGSLWPVRMPGGAQAIRQPWRMACAWLSEALGSSADEPSPVPSRLAGRIDAQRWAAVSRIGAQPSVSPLTSSMGRLFDAVGALCGLAVEVTYEGQAAVALEAAAWRAATGQRRGPGPYVLARSPDGRLDPRGALRALASDLEAGASHETVAADFHAGVAAATVSALSAIAVARGLGTAVLSGGVFQNRLLLETVAGDLEQAGLRVLIPQRLPPNDGGISYGQAAVAATLSAG